MSSLGADPQSAELPATLPPRRLDVEVAEFDTEFVVFDPRHRMAHRLSGWLAGVFDACDGQTSSHAFLGECGAVGLDGPGGWGSPDELRRQLGAALGALEHSGLLAGTEPPSPPPCLGCDDAAAPRRRRRSSAR